MTLRSTIAAALIIISAAVMGACASPTTESATPQKPAAQSTATTTAPSPTSDAVPVSRPTRLTFAAAQIDGPVEEYTAADAEADGGINPPTLSTIAWYSGIADSLPGTNATNTVYIFGHTWVEPAVFNGLTAVRIGDEATLQTETGALTYAVEQIISMDKAEFTSNDTVAAIVPGRLVLVTCHRPDGWDPTAAAPDNTAIVLQLIGSRAGG